MIILCSGSASAVPSFIQILVDLYKLFIFCISFLFLYTPDSAGFMTADFWQKLHLKNIYFLVISTRTFIDNFRLPTLISHLLSSLETITPWISNLLNIQINLIKTMFWLGKLTKQKNNKMKIPSLNFTAEKVTVLYQSCHLI